MMEMPAVDTPNIGVRECRRRRAGGVVGLALAIAGCLALMLFGAARWWRLGLVAPLMLATFGYFQAREKT